MFGKILSLSTLIALSLTLASCGSTSYSDFNSTPESWRAPNGATPTANGGEIKGKAKKMDAQYFTDKAIERFDRF
jgi:hypothetical protein